ncbi:MAG: MFS transporter [Chloroflexota bacterium]|nr:MFS transporter [Chloroflexota bacterium]MDE2961720.1 MFS transporter [Chloroflexota bacterium]
MIDSEHSSARLPLLNKLLFTADHIGLQSISYFRQQWVLFFLAPPAMEGVARVPDASLLGFDIDARVLAGFLIFAGRFIDAFTDPLIGWWSDRTRSRWGRRIPFVLFSTPFYVIFGALIWFLPTEGSSWWNALYFVLMLELFFTAATMSSGALEALVPELTRTANERMHVVCLIFLFAVAGAGLGLVMGGFIKDAYGFQIAGTFFAALALVFRYLSLRAVWRRAPRDITPAQVPFWRGFKDTLRNSQFIAFLPTFVMFTTGVGILQGWVPFFAVGVLLQDKDGVASSFLSMSVIAGVVVAGIVIWMLFSAGRVTKRRVYGVCLVASGLVFPLTGLTGLALPGSLLLQGLAFMFIAGMPMAAVFLLPKGLTADIADYDALVRGERREAMFYATQNFFEKLTYALPPLLLSLVLQLGDSAENPLGIRLAPLLAGALVLVGFTLWPRYRLPDTINRETVTQAGLMRQAA